MREVSLTFFADDVDVTFAYERVADFARYPTFTDQVVSVSVAPQVENEVISDWTVRFRKGLLQWTERDVLDQAAGTITFTQLTGDFAEFDGQWLLTKADGGTQVSFNARFDLGMPTLAEVLDPVAESALRENIELILTGLLGPVKQAVPA